MPELGTKHECAGCGAKFYDLGKPEPICPRCGLNQLQEEEPEPPARNRKAKPAAEPEPEKGKAPEAGGEEPKDGDEGKKQG